MGEERNPLQQQTQCFPVNGGDHFQGHQRKACQYAGHAAAIERPAAQAERGIEQAGLALEHVQMHRQMRSRRGGMPAIVQIHGHEGRNVQGLGEVGPLPALVLISYIEHIGDLLTPRRIGNLGDQRIQCFAIGLEAVVNADRIDAITEIAQMGQQADRALRPAAGALLNQIARAMNVSGATPAARASLTAIEAEYRRVLEAIRIVLRVPE